MVFLPNKEEHHQFRGVQDQARLWSYIFGFTQSLLLRSAVELRIADVVHSNGGLISLSHLASQLASQLPPPQKIETSHLFRIMRILVHMKLFNHRETSNGDHLYGLEPAARLLVRDSDTSMAPIILGMTQEDFMLPWHFMKEGLSDEGGTAFETAMGMTIWDYLAKSPEKSSLFNEAMAGETRLLTSSLVGRCEEVFRGLESVVDVGGGNGTTIKAVAKAFPNVKCTVFDLPHVIDGSDEIPGIQRVAGDMFESVPRAQAILLKLILHDWSDEDCVKILKRCKEAVPPKGGKVIIVDVVLDAKSDHRFSKPRMVLDIDMLVNTGGRERTEEDWKELIHQAGYKGFQIRNIEAIQSVIEAYP